MEVINIKKITALALLLLAVITVNAQDLTSRQTAFANSYAYEKKSEYAKAISEILGVYSADSYECNLRLGWLYYGNGSYQTSAQYYSKAIVLMPYSIEARMGYVMPEKALGHLEQVKAAYEAILKIDPQHSYANYNLGLALYNEKDFQSAFTYIEKAANLYPFDYDIALLYAWVNFQLGKLAQAKLLFQKTLLIKPEDASALEGLSLIK